MSARRQGRCGLNPDDLALWERAMKDATPLRRRQTRLQSAAPTAEPPVMRQRSHNERPAPKGPLGVDGSTDRKLRRGTVDIDATLDLHGETQTRAFDRLVRFIGVAEATGRRSILVITGKGGPKREEDFEADWRMAQTRGVLRRMVPQWLKEPPLHDKVLAVRPAHNRHGGSGAFYVILRKPGTRRVP